MTSKPTMAGLGYFCSKLICSLNGLLCKALPSKSSLEAIFQGLKKFKSLYIPESVTAVATSNSCFRRFFCWNFSSAILGLDFHFRFGFCIHFRFGACIHFRFGFSFWIRFRITVQSCGAWAYKSLLTYGKK